MGDREAGLMTKERNGVGWGWGDAGVCAGWLNALDCNPSGQDLIPGRDSLKDRFSVFPGQLRLDKTLQRLSRFHVYSMY